MGITVRPGEIQERPTDNRGRAYLGAEYANKNVTVAVLDVEP